MGTSLNDLNAIFARLLVQFYAAELKYAKLFMSLSALSMTEELRASLSADRNEFAQQTERTAQVMKLLKLPAAKELTEVDRALLESGKSVGGGKKKQGSLGRDVDILGLARQITYCRIAKLSSLIAMARELEMEPVVALMEQSCTECRNTAAYFGQIEQNILYPNFRHAVQ